MEDTADTSLGISSQTIASPGQPMGGSSEPTDGSSEPTGGRSEPKASSNEPIAPHNESIASPSPSIDERSEPVGTHSPSPTDGEVQQAATVDNAHTGSSHISPELPEGQMGTQVTTTSDLMENVKQRAEDQRVQEGEDSSKLAKDVYHVKWVRFKGCRVPIVTQNVNGPCPLLAIVNVLLLKEKVVLDQSAEVVTSSQLMGYLGDILLQAMPDNLPQGEQANWEQNVNDAIAVFHKLQTGLDVNVRFTGVRDFEYTPECVVFDLLNIPLFHGWLVDRALPETVEAVGNLTYNQLVEKVIENQGSVDVDKSTDAVLGQMFLDESASQLTYHGLAELSSTINEDQMAVFFRNNHFSTIYKHRGHLFLLITDQGYLRQSRIVWEALSNVEGDGDLVDSDFRIPQNLEPVAPSSVPANTQEQVDQDLLLALSLTNQEQSSQPAPSASTHETDEAFAKRLQEEENRQAAIQHQEAERTANKPAQDGYAQRRPRQNQPRDEAHGAPQRQRERRDSGSCVLL